MRDRGFMHSRRSGRKLSTFSAAALALLAGVLFCVPIPACADFCVQVSGGPFSGDLGFFRFKGSLPKAKGAMVSLAGRVAGLSPVFGAATVQLDGSGVELGATFFADAEQGQIDLFFPLPLTRSSAGSGYGDYGAYGTGASLTANLVSCKGEP